MDCHEPVTGRRTGQLVLDYLTDAVLSHKATLMGQPHVAPDSSLVVTVDTENHVKIVVQKVTGGTFSVLNTIRITLTIVRCVSYYSRIQTHLPKLSQVVQDLFRGMMQEP